MRLVVGLGNPGESYQRTRHNIGAELVLRYAAQQGVSLRSERFRSLAGEGGGEKVMFLLPQTYMNRSGEAVGDAVRFFRLNPGSLLVVHDDIDLTLGRIKLDFSSGAAGHKGVLSVTDHLQTAAFYRLRLGIGRPPTKEEVESYVLSPFRDEERPAVETMLSEGAKSLDQWITRKEP